MTPKEVRFESEEFKEVETPKEVEAKEVETPKKPARMYSTPGSKKVNFKLYVVE